MREIATVLGGIGLLIFAYLCFTQSGGFSTVVGSVSSLLTGTIGTLQGGGGGGSLGGFSLPNGIR